MTTLTHLSCVPTGLRHEFDTITALEMEDVPLGSGGFGEVYACRTLNGQPPPFPLVLKTLLDDGQGSLQHGSQTILRLQERLRDLEASRLQRGEVSLCDVPGLLAVPQFSFEAQHRGQRLWGYGVLRLDTLGYVAFDTITDGDVLQMGNYLTLPLEQRLQSASDLAEAMALLQSLDYVHGDLNPQNLFVHPVTGRLALIDFDSGAVVIQPGDQPATWGKPGDWLAPEVADQLVGATAQVQVDRWSDAWAVGIGLHYLLFLHHPLIYLKDFGTNTLRHYGAANLWPQIDPSDPLYHPANDAAYQYYRQELQRLPASVFNAFDVLLNQGVFAPNQRPDCQTWQRALSALQTPPVILAFTVDRLRVPAGGTVRLTWQVEHTQALHLVGIGDVTGRTQYDISLRHSTAFTLRASNRVGQAQAISPPIQVIQGPVVRYIAPPRVSMSLQASLAQRLSHPSLTELVFGRAASLGRHSFRFRTAPFDYLSRRAAYPRILASVRQGTARFAVNAYRLLARFPRFRYTP